MLKGPVNDGKGECITLVSVISLLSLTIVVGHALMLIILWKDPFKRFRTPPTFLVCGMVLANFTSGLSAGPLFCYYVISSCSALRPPYLELLWNAASFMLYWTTSVSYLSMLGLSLCQYIGVKLPHKHSGLVTKKTTASFLGIITFISFLIPGLLPLGVSPIIVEKLQLHVTFQLSTFILCALYAALGVEYLQQVKRARESSNNAVKGMTCVRVRDRNFTRANLMLLACVTLLSLPIMITWHLSMYGEKLFSSKTGQTASGAVTITLFMMKITLDPFIYCMRLTIHRKAFKRIFKWRNRQVAHAGSS
ncbi:unnamed protein product [Porites lobata]|uniref:G-protein coupled receptors family 1 profile domain-containing protein n=1 Tax=Porites lobata TaxID=104759 RepID=A0ABN8S279_9CNID|nr:unnamed protein product [Porites lobata]